MGRIQIRLTVALKMKNKSKARKMTKITMSFVEGVQTVAERGIRLAEDASVNLVTDPFEIRTVKSAQLYSHPTPSMQDRLAEISPCSPRFVA